MSFSSFSQVLSTSIWRPRIEEYNETLSVDLVTHIAYGGLDSQNALIISKKHKVKRFIHASSIYANTEEGGFYGSSKQAAECYIERFHAIFGLKYAR